MRTFLIERDLGGISMPDLHGLVASSLRQVARMREEGDLVHYFGSTFLPAEGRCLCLYQAKDEAASIQLTRATAYLRLGDGAAAAYWAERSTAHRTAYGQMLYHASLILEAAGYGDRARATLAALAEQDPPYDVTRYFAGHYAIPDDIRALLRRSQQELAKRETPGVGSGRSRGRQIGIRSPT